MKVWLIGVNIVLCIVCAIAAYRVSEPFWQPLFISASTVFFASAWGVLLINIYLDIRSRRDAVTALYLISEDALLNVHNNFLDLMWSRFGRARFAEIVDQYTSNDGDPQALSPEDRDKFYREISDNREEVLAVMNDLEKTLDELCRLAGWNLDARILASALFSRKAISKFRSVEFDDTDESKLSVVEQLFDADIHASDVRDRLLKLARLNEE